MLARSAHAEGFIAAAGDNPDSTLVALDFDGTLSEMVEDPEQAFIHPEARRALAELIGRVGHVAIITGRPVDQVRRLGYLNDDLLQKLIVLGQYGAERLDSDGRRVPDAAPSVRRAIEELQPLADEYPGLFIEDKQHAVGVHTRRAPKGTLAKVESTVVAVAQRLGLEVEPGKEVLELRAHRVSKGEALRGLMRETAAEAVAMVGDDLGDISAFDVIKEHQASGKPGLVVVSGSEERPELTEMADMLCGGPAGVAVWMDSVGVNPA
ncbi:MAG: trehalose-phosphatase [Propionibacterium sp.]|nr:trehalose-phosphatase [Propionibacterium sp.]